MRVNGLQRIMFTRSGGVKPRHLVHVLCTNHQSTVCINHARYRYFSKYYLITDVVLSYNKGHLDWWWTSLHAAAVIPMGLGSKPRPSPSQSHPPSYSYHMILSLEENLLFKLHLDVPVHFPALIPDLHAALQVPL